MNPFTILAFALLVGGVATSIRSTVPGGPAMSLAGVLVYWWSTGYAEPSGPILGVVLVLVLLEKASGIVTPELTKRIGGISSRTMSLASTIAGVLAFVAGTKGFVVGLAVATFVLEYIRRGDARESAVAALVMILSTVAQKGVKILIALGILLIMVGVVLL